MERIICLIIGYAFGLFQTGYFVGKLNHVDIRKTGSGNSGSTNALRVLGVKAGLMTFAGDVLKCVLPILLVRRSSVAAIVCRCLRCIQEQVPHLDIIIRFI